jgi:two-component sensor histidine kinase
VNNLLAMVGAIAHQTKVEHVTAEAYRASLMGRITALAAAHEAAFQTDTGTDLGSLIGRLLEPYVDDGCDGVVTIETSPPVSVPRGKVQALAFVLHELATNAVKHGALSTPEGRLRLGWTVDEGSKGRLLHLAWREIGGPVVIPPGASGFGMKLLRHASAGELGGNAELHFLPEGLAVDITVRLGGRQHTCGLGMIRADPNSAALVEHHPATPCSRRPGGAAASHSCSLDHRRRVSLPLTAIATALGCATSTTSCRPRVTAV